MCLHVHFLVLPAVELLGRGRLQQGPGLLDASVQVGKGLQRLLALPLLGGGARQVRDAGLGHARDGEDLEGEGLHVLVQAGAEVLGVGVDALFLGVRLGLGEDGVQAVEDLQRLGHVRVVEGHFEKEDRTLNSWTRDVCF